MIKMKFWNRIVPFILLLLFLGACKSTQTQEVGELGQKLEQRNRNNISLLQRIRQLPGITISNGVPVIINTSNSIDKSANVEPLYLLDDYIVGNNFRALNELVDSYNVKSVRKLSSSEASYYGSRAGNGVIQVTTY
jgi:hypothetical protein